MTRMSGQLFCTNCIGRDFVTKNDNALRRADFSSKMAGETKLSDHRPFCRCPILADGTCRSRGSPPSEVEGFSKAESYRCGRRRKGAGSGCIGFALFPKGAKLSGGECVMCAAAR